MLEVVFSLNDAREVVSCSPTETVLDWLRERRGLTGTKEGCNEGDCGACSVLVTDKEGTRVLNACILFLPQIHGKALRTVEGVSGPAGEMHPVQTAMVAHHGSQCGFCTPGFVVAMAGAHKDGAQDFDTLLAGNLCRCTGYAPIARAAAAAASEPVPPWMAEDLPSVDGLAVAPESVDELAAWYAAHPDGTLIAGATDVGLWVTKDFRDLGPVAFLNRVDELNVFEEHSDRFEIGAMVTVADVERQMRAYEPGFADLLVRYGSDQVRQAATLGGNIANGSPIGDGSPALIAMGARLHLRKGTARREIALEDFFLRYGQQDRASGEFVERITVPKQAARRAFYKVSKRFDQDISAVCGCFSLRETDGVMRDVRLAFGGMAGTPMRAAKAEALMEGASPAAAVFAKAAAALAKDFSPMTDMRGTAHYRMEAAQGLLRRFWLERVGVVTDLHGVTA